MGRTPSLALGFATIERPQVVQRLIRSIRRYFPDLPIYAADQSREIGPMMEFYRDQRVHLIRMPFDSGVTASRNRLAATITEDYFVLTDDDFIIAPETDFADAVTILEQNPSLGVVGGRLYDLDAGEEWLRNWELYLEYDPIQKLLITVPIYHLAPKVEEICGIRYYACDAVLNFAVMRRSMFRAGAQWDERFKSNGEHEDFYLNLKVNTPFRVTYLPTMVAYHHHPEEYRVYRSRLRLRDEGWKRFLEKWGLEQHLELGLGVRSIDDVGMITDCDAARQRFFINPPLATQRSRASADALAVDGRNRIATLGALDEMGRKSQARPAAGQFLLNRVTGAMLVGTDATSHEEAVPAPSGLAKRLQLISDRRGDVVGVVTKELYFQYDAILRNDADFYVWYWCGTPLIDAAGEWAHLAVTVRWTASDGQNLIWRSRRLHLDLEAAAYWRPLHLEVPLLPQGATWLRFDILTDGGPRPDPVCTGFVWGRPASPQTSNWDTDTNAAVLALTRLPNDGVNPMMDGQPLKEIGRSVPRIPVACQRPIGTPGLTLRMIDVPPEIEALYFMNWDALPRPLVGARLPPAERPGIARRLALPKPEGKGSTLLGFGANAGLVEFDVTDPSTLPPQ